MSMKRSNPWQAWPRWAMLTALGVGLVAGAWLLGAPVALAETVQSCRRRGCKLDINTYRCICPRKRPRASAARRCRRRGCRWIRRSRKCRCRRPAPRRVSRIAPRRRPGRLAPAKLDRRTGITWVTIGGGTFKMGDKKVVYSRPIHKVRVKTFLMAKSTITVAQYGRCVKARVCKPPKTGSRCSWNKSGKAQHPVNCVTWHQAQKYAKWAGGRLPSEAQWEFAARSRGKPWIYPWGNEKPTCARTVMAVSRGCVKGGPQRVCSKPPGHTVQGLCDMAGNVWEWTADWFHRTYAGAPTDGSAWLVPKKSYRVVRGGGWGAIFDNSRTTYRSSKRPTSRYGHLGFRIVRTP